MTRRKKVWSIDKSNVLETSRLWREVAERVIKTEFPGVSIEHMLVDSAAMHLIRRPRDFDVLVTENMFGDILTDEGAMLASSLGVLPSASIGDGRRGLYEPIHGSAPDIAGKSIANPVGTILSVALLLKHSLGLETEAAAVEAAVSTAIDEGARTADIAEKGTYGAQHPADGRRDSRRAELTFRLIRIEVLVDGVLTGVECREDALRFSHLRLPAPSRVCRPCRSRRQNRRYRRCSHP